MARSVRTDHAQNYMFRAMVVDDATGPFGVTLPQSLPQAFTVLGNFASFARISIPSVTLETEEFKEGNWPFRRRVITAASVDTITMERGVTLYDSDFWLWASAALNGLTTRKSLLINLMHRTQEPALGPSQQQARQKAPVLTGSAGVNNFSLVTVQLRPTIPIIAKAWVLHEAIPVRIKPASDLDAASSEVSIAELEIHANWIEQKPFPFMPTAGPNLMIR